MELNSFRICVIYQAGDLFSSTGRIDNLKCPYCNSIWFYDPSSDEVPSLVDCSSCYQLLDIPLLFARTLDRKEG